MITKGQSPLSTSSGIVWTSSNPEVATVDSSGVVTGVELGEATITATLNGSVIETFTVYSTLSDGFYTMKAYVSSHYLCPQDLSMADDVTMCALETTKASFAEEGIWGEIGHKWYFEYHGRGLYSIHPAYCRDMVLYLATGIKPALRQKSEMADNSWYWKLLNGSGGYVLQNREYTSVGLAFEAQNSNYSALIGVAHTPEDSTQKWTISSSVSPSGILLFENINGTLINDTWGTCTEEYTVYVHPETDCSLSDLNLYVQILDPDESNQTFIFSTQAESAIFTQGNSRFSISGTENTTATISRIIGGTKKAVEINLSIRSAEIIWVRYDSAYIYRYSNAFSRINQQTQIAAQKLATYGRSVTFASPTPFISYGDSCGHYTRDCSHATDSECVNATVHFESENATYLHHKNAHNIAYEAPFSEDGEKSLIYIGHTVCRKAYDLAHLNNHTTDGYLCGMCVPEKNLVQVSNHLSLEASTQTTFHEIGHLFGAIDHYGSTTTPNMYSTEQMQRLYPSAGFNRYCIYGEEKTDATVVSNMTVCSGCQKAIRGELNN